jgi:hypothetical protein
MLRSAISAFTRVFDALWLPAWCAADPGPDATQHERCDPEPILLCMGLFSRFCVRALRCTAEEALRCVRDTRSLVLRAYGDSIQLQLIMLQ